MMITSLNWEDFKILIKQSVREAIEELTINTKQIPQNTSKPLSRKEAASFLQISLPTLHSYTQRGLIKATKIGKSIRYRIEDIEASLLTKKAGGKNG
ncbi:helix-turn-helix domain-containing protein [Pedobacter sp. SG908]|uniref:helix-turn-helix domain-containing protein n=1 Tax=Pedobacter sp. SG908 TaxID=2587135 RepID=UPI001420CE03|nr:helix-turn-helix domain-containing protein [Pedobacter sp. SG908]NII81199.1 excisionase family DNA binding protein [Pedobacter sp. SG908]